MSVVETEKVAELLEAARDRMNTSGKHWMKGRFRTHKNGIDSFCALGGLRAAVLGELDVPEEVEGRFYYDEELMDAWGNETYGAAVMALAKTINPEGYEDRFGHLGSVSEDELAEVEELIFGWNDHSQMTWEKVSSTFRRAAQRVREGK